MVKNFTGKPPIIIAHRRTTKIIDGESKIGWFTKYFLPHPNPPRYIGEPLRWAGNARLEACGVREPDFLISSLYFVISGNERTYADLVTTSGLEEIAKYAQAVGIHKNLLVPRDSNGKLRRRGAACRQTSPTSLVIDAHVAGLLVHVWTFRNEDCFLPLDFQGNPQGEYELFSLGVDGVFSDYPDTAGFHSTVQW